ncbi:HD domain-containing protein [Sporosarcina sp. G11-34]|uniref:HD domain-containing protein n=1 Tax=Sporosarcina sp. G11-34 TaxID=2849605 RepID=UPI0022A936B7|nr:HD domain-containing protein [Sporosarcina sp. G11-34]MCZ2257752.1 HD domain-containing protein [Sporosarcina sp. G11-34]
MNLVEKALRFAAVKHEGQYRKGTNIPYITHPVAVAMILKKAKYSDEVVAAGLLHDTLEDTETTEAELIKEFGKCVFQFVQAASETDKRLSWEERKECTIAELPVKTQEELAVIVADKLHNVRSMHSDVKEHGDKIWMRFNRGKREQSWYYMSVLKTLDPRKEEVKIIKELKKEIYLLFVGDIKLTFKQIDMLFSAAYFISEGLAEELREIGLLDFVKEAKEEADINYRNDYWQLVEPLFKILASNEVEFERNSDGPMILLCYCAELKHRLAWTDDEFVRHFKRNLRKL